MCKTDDTYYTLIERIEDGFSEIDSDITVDLLDTDAEYAAMRKESRELSEAHPFIERTLDGKGAINLSEEEHAVLVRYVNLARMVEDRERRQIYFRGHTDSYAYLKKIGVI